MLHGIHLTANFTASHNLTNQMTTHELMRTQILSMYDAGIDISLHELQN